MENVFATPPRNGPTRAAVEAALCLAPRRLVEEEESSSSAFVTPPRICRESVCPGAPRRTEARPEPSAPLPVSDGRGNGFVTDRYGRPTNNDGYPRKLPRGRDAY